MTSCLQPIEFMCNSCFHFGCCYSSVGNYSFLSFKVNDFNSMNLRKKMNLESMVSVHCTTLLEHVTIMRRSCFDIKFTSQILLTKLPLNHCFIVKQSVRFLRFVTLHVKVPGQLSTARESGPSTTRMHSSRMRTVRCSGRRGGGSACLDMSAQGGGVSAPVHAGIHPPCEQNGRKV